MRENPFGVSVLGSINFGNPAREREVLNALVNRGLAADKNRMDWVERQKSLSKLRFGIRRQKTFPWPGASNISIPLIDYAIRKYKPILFRLFTEPTPLVEFMGTDDDAASAERRAEQTFDWLFKIEMESLDPMAYLLDSMTHRGYSYIQVGWEYSTEYVTRILDVAKVFAPNELQALNRDLILSRLVQEYRLDPSDTKTLESLNQAADRILGGSTMVKLAFKEIIADRPALYDRDAITIISPPRTTNIKNAEWLVVQHVFSLRTLEQKEADGFFDKGTVTKLRASMQAEEERRQRGRVLPPAVNEVEMGLADALYKDQAFNDEREKIWGTEDEDNILVWQCYHWYDYNNDGLAERCETFIHPKSLTKMRSTAFAGPWRRWPLVKFDFEKTNRRLNSPRGISQMLMDIQIETNAQHNAKIDGMTLRNSPAYQVSVLSGFRTRNFRVVPGTVLETPAGAQITPILQDRGSFPEQTAEENLLRGIAESYIGIFDAAITSPASQSKARTATEITAIIQYTSSTSTMDAMLFQASMKEVYQLVWDLWLDLGPEEFFIPSTGGVQGDEEARKMIKVRKSEINKKFKLNPTGTVLNTNRALELANAREAVTMYVNDVTGIIDERELRNWHLNLLAPPRWARRIVRSPEAAQYVQTLKQAAAALQTEPQIMRSMQGPVSQEAPEQPTSEVGASSQYGGMSQR